MFCQSLPAPSSLPVLDLKWPGSILLLHHPWPWVAAGWGLQVAPSPPQDAAPGARSLQACSTSAFRHTFPELRATCFQCEETLAGYTRSGKFSPGWLSGHISISVKLPGWQVQGGRWVLRPLLQAHLQPGQFAGEEQQGAKRD